MPVLEVAILDVRNGEQAAFEQAFREAQSIIASMPGYLEHSIRRCIEKPSRYILLVEWQELEHHIHGFRDSPEYVRWKSLLHRFYEPFPEVEHYEQIAGLEGRRR